MNTLFHFKFKYTEDEIIKAHKENFISNRRLVFDLLISVFLISISLFLIINDQTTILYSFMLFIGILIILLLTLRIFVLPVIIFRRTAKYHHEYNLEFNEEKIIFSSGNNRSEIDWSYYKKIKETKKYLYLYYSKNAYTIIPKRIFEDKKSETEFIKFVTRKINK